MLVPSSELIHLWKDPFAGTSGVLLGRAEERLAKAMDAMPTTQLEEGDISASSKSEGEGAGWKESPPPGIGESSREKGGKRRASLKEEENGGCSSPQAG